MTPLINILHLTDLRRNAQQLHHPRNSNTRVDNYGLQISQIRSVFSSVARRSLTISQSAR